MNHLLDFLLFSILCVEKVSGYFVCRLGFLNSIFTSKNAFSKIKNPKSDSLKTQRNNSAQNFIHTFKIPKTTNMDFHDIFCFSFLLE